MDLAALVKTIEGLAAQIGHLETRIQDQAVASEQRLAAIEASIQNEEESVGGGSRMQSRRNGRRQAVRNNNGQDGHDPEEKALKSIKVEAPNFDGQLNAKVCLDWISDMDHYFDWYELSETRRVRFAKMKLVGKAREWWSGVERRAARAGDEPITHWEEMKERLKEKYVPLAYKERLLDQWQSLRQGNMTVAEYIDKFEEFMVRCNINEDPSVTLARFRTGLRPELQRELIPHEVYSLERAYQIVLELERYLKTSTTVHSRSDQENPEFRPSSSGTAPSPFVNSSSTANSLVKADTGKGVQSGVRGGGSVKCYKCLGHGHYAGQCPTKEKPRSLFAASTGKEAREELEEEVYIPEIPAVDDDLEDEPIAQIQPRTAVVRCTLTQLEAAEDWKRTSIFHTYVKYGDRSYKVIIDNGSCVNIVPIQFSSYKDTVWCDVVPMDVGHILLGRPWLYDLDVTISGRSNSCSFIHEGKHIKLNPIQPKPVLQLPCKGGQQAKSLNIIVPRDVVENIVDEQVVSTRQGGYQKYSIKWKEKPDSDKEELQHTNPDILERYYSFISPEASSSQPGRIDEDIIVKPFKVYERNKWKEKAPNHSR
ncbi:PREDICTED: uncharacterized protein LOC101305082 [Fragaria vesca subsp. vesca]